MDVQSIIPLPTADMPLSLQKTTLKNPEKSLNENIENPGTPEIGGEHRTPLKRACAEVSRSLLTSPLPLKPPRALQTLFPSSDNLCVLGFLKIF